VTNGCSVEGKEKRTKNRSLGNTSCKWSEIGAVISDGDVLRPVGKVRFNEGEHSVREAKRGGES
jgi:hypothetical protein